MSERERCPTCGAEVPGPEDFGVDFPPTSVFCLRSTIPRSPIHKAECLERALDARDERLRAVEAEAAAIRRAAVAFKESLGEYVRQSMYFNPEWSAGLKALDAALSGTAGRALLDEVERLRKALRQMDAAYTAAWDGDRRIDGPEMQLAIGAVNAALRTLPAAGSEETTPPNLAAPSGFDDWLLESYLHRDGGRGGGSEL